MEEVNNGKTLKEICRIIWSKKWIALIVAVLVALVMAVALYYGYNPKVKTCEIEFSLNLPGSDDSAFYSYPDGEVFHYSELTSVKTLKAIKEDGEFENVNVEKMVSKSDISVSRTITATAAATEANPYREVAYNVSVKLSYFNGMDQAKDFLTRVANYPTEYLENMEIDYDVYLPLAKAAVKADNKARAVTYLNAQLDFLSKEYDKLIETYGGTFVVSSGKTLLACKQQVAYAYEADDSLNVEAAYTTVNTLTYSFRMTSKAVYAKAASVAFTQPSIIVARGGMGLVKIFLFSVVVAVIVALIAAYVAGYLSLKKKKAVKESAVEEQPSVKAEEPETDNKE